jgi:hypothetical protein
MLRKLRRQPLLAGAGEVLLDAIRYMAIIIVLVVVLGYIAGLAAGSP